MKTAYPKDALGFLLTLRYPYPVGYSRVDIRRQNNTDTIIVFFISSEENIGN